MDSQIICPICRSKKTLRFWAGRGYRLSKCLVCSMVWEHLPPEDVLAQYSKTYFINENPKGGYANYFAGMSINRKTFTDRLNKIEKKLSKKAKLLDVGCALGDCLAEAKRLGWQNIQGLEVSEFAVKAARERGLTVKQGVLKPGIYPVNSFDVVTYQDVIEHIPDPVAELERVYKILKPGGLLFIVTPDVGGSWSKLLGSNWYHYKPGEHVNYFSQQSITKALQEAGFTQIETGRTYHVLSLEYILNRLRYYSPNVFDWLLRIVKKLSLKDLPFRAYTGELEAFAWKSA